MSLVGVGEIINEDSAKIGDCLKNVFYGYDAPHK